jgi:hypothetical protein
MARKKRSRVLLSDVLGGEEKLEGRDLCLGR